MDFMLQSAKARNVSDTAASGIPRVILTRQKRCARRGVFPQCFLTMELLRLKLMSESVICVAEDMTSNPLFSCHTSVAAPRPAENLPADTAGCDFPRPAIGSSVFTRFLNPRRFLGWSPNRNNLQ